MLHTLFLVPALPLAGFFILALFGRALPRAVAGWIGAGTVGASAVLTLLIAGAYLGGAHEEAFIQTLWNWARIGDFQLSIAFHLDALSLLMMVVITFVGFLIHVYSTEYMQQDEGFSRFFAYMNLFVAMMLVLVMGDNLVLLYFGWEGVGLCSYLLIGFWYRDPANGSAARKAFIVTRVGDAAMAVALFLIFHRLGTLHIQTAMQRALVLWPAGSMVAYAAALLLLGGAVGKSAQLPLQVWLPDAMAGPTPVSALIHAATMVTAGVYLIARTHILFQLAPAVMMIVATVGVLTLLLAGFSAIVQTDIKRILAYSTISQIGYMFLALGVGAFSAAMFHFMTHAFFKALLFLAAGYVIESMHHEQNIFKMGGLRARIPACFWTFLIGSASLAAIPFVTAGFYSKDLILMNAWLGGDRLHLLWLGGVIGAFLTALYSFRLIFVVFYGPAHHEVSHIPGRRMLWPLVILSIFAIVAGFVETPRALGAISLFSRFMVPVLPHTHQHEPSAGLEWMLMLGSSGMAIVGIIAAYALYMPLPRRAERLALVPANRAISQLWLKGWGFDALYDRFS